MYIWPKDQESSLGNMNFQNLIFVRRSRVQRLWQLQGQCIVNISDTGGSFSVFRLRSANGGITSGTPQSETVFKLVIEKESKRGVLWPCKQDGALLSFSRSWGEATFFLKICHTWPCPMSFGTRPLSAPFLFRTSVTVTVKLARLLWNLTHLCFRLVTSMVCLDLLADLGVILGRLHQEQSCQVSVLI